MASDLERDTWEAWEELLDGYMEGSAAVIGEMMLPVLEPYSAAAKEPARALGNAFQLTSFLRDVAEDLDRGRVYLPQADLRRHGADPWLRTVTPAWRAMMAEQVARAHTCTPTRRKECHCLPPPGAAGDGPGALQSHPRPHRSRRLRRVRRTDPRAGRREAGGRAAVGHRRGSAALTILRGP